MTPEPRVTRYTMDVFPHTVNAGIWCINIEETGDNTWAVRRGPWCLNRRTMDWDYEPMPSNRSDRFLSTHRFPLDQALALAQKAFPKIKINGRTPEQALAEFPNGVRE